MVSAFVHQDVCDQGPSQTLASVDEGKDVLMKKNRDRQTRESIANRIREAAAQRKLEPEQASKLLAATEQIFHAAAIKDTKGTNKAILELCKCLLK